MKVQEGKGFWTKKITGTKPIANREIACKGNIGKNQLLMLHLSLKFRVEKKKKIPETKANAMYPLFN